MTQNGTVLFGNRLNLFDQPTDFVISIVLQLNLQCIRMSSIYKVLETYDKSNKILQATKEEEIALSLGKHYRRVNELYNELKYASEKQKLEDNAKIIGLQEKLKLLEQEISKNLKQCAELEGVLNTYKESIRENQRKLDDNTAYYEKKIHNLKDDYDKKIQLLERENHHLKQNSPSELLIMKRLENFEKLSNEGQTNPFGDCDTANTSFQDCLPYEKESKVESLLQKIETFLAKNGDGASALEGQIDKLQNQLTEAKEQCIIDRQMARNANLSVWKLEKQIAELENEKRALNRKLEYANSKMDSFKVEINNFEPKIAIMKEEVQVKERIIRELKENMQSIRTDKDLERDLRITYEQKCIKQKSDIMEYLAKIRSLEERFATKTQMLNSVQKKNDELIAEQQRLQYKLSKIDDTCTKINTMAASKSNELDNLMQNYEMLKKACLITDKQISELETRLKKEIDLRAMYFDKYNTLKQELNQKEESYTNVSKKYAQETSMRQKAETVVSKASAEIDENKKLINQLKDKLNNLQVESDGKSKQITKLQKQVEQLSDETLKLREVIRAHEKEINFLKEGNTQVLSDLYTAREEIESHKQVQDEADRQLNNLLKELNFKEGVIEEQKNCQTKMDVKSTTMIAQYKKMIDFLQNKVEISERKKKGITSKFFG